MSTTSTLFALLLVVSAADDGGKDARHPEAVQIFQCDFSSPRDVNHDAWPDGWTRKRGNDFPSYLKIAICADDTPAAPRMLRVELDGGGAAVFTPAVEVSPLFSYLLEVSVRSSGLQHDIVYASLTFLDADKRPLRTEHESHKLVGTQPWSRVRLGPISPEDEKARFVVIGLHVMPGPTGFDLRGNVDFSEVSLARLPRMVLSTNSQHNVYTSAEAVEVTCRLSGVLEPNPEINFELCDLAGAVVAKERLKVSGKPVTAAGTMEAVSTMNSAENSQVLGYKGDVVWRPQIADFGFYHVRAWMEAPGGEQHRRSLSLVVARSQPTISQGQFGWSLPEGDQPLSLAALPSLLSQSGIHWVKFPLWYGARDHQRADELAQFAERLSSLRIELVGLLDQPPPEVRHLFGEGDDRLPAAGVFAEPELWFPALNPVYTRMSMKVRWWQLGRDDDYSFYGNPAMPNKLRGMKTRLERYGQKVHLGLPWRWINEAPSEAGAPLAFLSLGAEPVLTAEELTTYLTTASQEHAAKNSKAAAPQVPAKRWAVLEPLSAEHYSLATRAQDLASRMLAIKLTQADAAFVPRPFSREHGLMKPDGTPGELYLPWRTMANSLSGSEFLGEIVMPCGSRNAVFTRGDETLMIVWNDQQVEETLNLGDPVEIEHIDLWGRTHRPEQHSDAQVYQVGPLPSIITGVNRELARWRIAFTVIDRQLATTFGRPQYPSFRLLNTFRQGVGGEMTVVTPEMWGKPPMPVRVKLAGGEELTDQFEIVLRSDASSGLQRVRFDFDIVADRPWKFSVWRDMEIGRGDVVLDLETRLDEDGNLVVEQRLTNKTSEEVNFKCLLFAPGRRRLRQNVLNLGAGTNSQLYVLPEGQDLIGKTLWVRAEEMAGQRVLNVHMQATP